MYKFVSALKFNKTWTEIEAYYRSRKFNLYSYLNKANRINNALGSGNICDAMW